MTLSPNQIYALLAIAGALIVLGVWFVYACQTAPLGEQTDEGFFYVKPLGGDHE